MEDETEPTKEVIEEPILSRQWTDDEIRDQFMNHMLDMVDFWVVKSHDLSIRESLEGLLFSFLCATDGVSDGCPTMLLVCDSDPGMEDYVKEAGEGENWYPHQEDSEIEAGVINGTHHLHEMLKSYIDKRIADRLSGDPPCHGCGEVASQHPNESGCLEWHE